MFPPPAACTCCPQRARLVIMLRPSLACLLACLATTVVALQTTATLRAVGRVPLGCLPRSRQLVATMRDLPAGWTTGFDQANQATYYVNEQTGQSQWEPPQQEYGSYDAYAQQQAQQQAPQQDYGTLDLDQYRQYTSDRGERVTETELNRRFGELNQAYNDSPDQYGQQAGGRDQFLQGGAGPSFKGGAYNFAGQQGRELSPLVEFLRWQEWYVSYCKLRNIGQGAQR